MIPRALARLVNSLVFILVLAFATGLIVGASRGYTAAAIGGLSRASTALLTSFGVLLLFAAIVVGLVVRLHGWLTGNTGAAGREREVRERQLRLVVRRPADDVPLIAAPEQPADPDPALPLEEGERG